MYDTDQQRTTIKAAFYALHDIEQRWREESVYQGTQSATFTMMMVHLFKANEELWDCIKCYDSEIKAYIQEADSIAQRLEAKA